MKLYGCKLCGLVFYNLDHIKEHLTEEEGHDIRNEYFVGVEYKELEEYTEEISLIGDIKNETNNE